VAVQQAGKRFAQGNESVCPVKREICKRKLKRGRRQKKKGTEANKKIKRP